MPVCGHWFRSCPAATRRLLVVGALPEVVEDQLRRLFASLGTKPVDFLPRRRTTVLPPTGPGTRVLLAQPFLGGTLRALIERGAVHLPAPFPFGVAGTTAWLQAAASEWRIADATFRAVTDPAATRAHAALARPRRRLAGKPCGPGS